MIVGIAVAELHISQARSLKDKRRVVKALVERIHSRFRVSVAETDFHDLHQRAEIAVAIVHHDEGELGRLLEQIRAMCDAEPEAYLTRWEPEILESGFSTAAREWGEEDDDAGGEDELAGGESTR